MNIISPKRPTGEGWIPQPKPPQWVTMGYAGEAWMHRGGLFVISAVEVAKDKDGVDRGPEYHISVSQCVRGGRNKRCSSSTALWVLAAFDLIEAKEDNHVPDGVVRNFWRPVADRLVGLECGCKQKEPAILLDKGDYVWRPA
jgi:hypothetical protein